MNLADIAISVSITALVGTSTVTAGVSVMNKVKNNLPTTSIERFLDEDFKLGDTIDLEGLNFEEVPNE